MGETIPGSIFDGSLVLMREGEVSIDVVYVPINQIAGLVAQHVTQSHRFVRSTELQLEREPPTRHRPPGYMENDVEQEIRDLYAHRHELLNKNEFVAAGKVRKRIDSLQAIVDRDLEGCNFAHLMDVARSKGFLVVVAGYDVDVTGFRSVAAGFTKFEDVKFLDDTLIYADWNYFSRIIGGVNSVGIYFSAIGASAGVQLRLADECMKSFERPHSRIDGICRTSEAVVRAYVTFFEVAGAAVGTPNPMSLQMDGTTWHAALVSTDRINDASEVASSVWALAYFREDGFLVDEVLWDKISQPVLLFGDVMPATISTHVGQVSCSVYVRSAAAYAN